MPEKLTKYIKYLQYNRKLFKIMSRNQADETLEAEECAGVAQPVKDTPRFHEMVCSTEFSEGCIVP